MAGLPSTFPYWSNARTSKVWLPSGRSLNSCGEEQGLKSPPSSRHWNCEFGLGEPNSKLAWREPTSVGRAHVRGALRRPDRERPAEERARVVLVAVAHTELPGALLLLAVKARELV